MKSLINSSRYFALSFLLTLATIFSANAGDKITYYHNDALGSPVAATNQLGQVIWRETYKPHGQRTTNAAASANNKVWFTGKQEESALGINYFGARWYHPEVGRFLVIDPAGVAPDNLHSFNRYAYANNNPYTHVDPSGGVVETAWDAFNIGIGVASFANNIRQGNYGSAAVDAVGVAVDGVAAAFPFLPGGAGAAIKAGRAADDVVDAVATAGRAKNNLKPVEGAEGAHSAFKRGADGKISNYATYEPNAKNPSGFQEVKRVDVAGRPHRNPDGEVIPTPHVKEAGVKGVRPANKGELP